MIEYFTKNIIETQLDEFVNMLFEAGAYGHLAHPFEDTDMTFGEMKDMIGYILSGQAIAYEKIDGQQISFSWKRSLSEYSSFKISRFKIL
jgi:hypothetical protein